MQVSISRAFIASFLMIFTLWLILFLSNSEAVLPRKNFSDFPKIIGQYIGYEAYFDKEIYYELGVDDSVLIFYRKPQENTIQLYIGYYNSQREGDLMHSPKNCLPGSGWNITDTTLEDVVYFAPDKKNIKVVRLLIQKGISKQVVLYWFQSRGRFISSEYIQKIFLVLDAITKNRTDGSFVRLMAPVTSDETTDITTEKLKEFAGILIPILDEYLPGKSL